VAKAAERRPVVGPAEGPSL